MSGILGPHRPAVTLPLKVIDAAMQADARAEERRRDVRTARPIQNGMKEYEIYLPTTQSDGTTIDHLGFRTKDIKTELADLEAKGVIATGPPRQDPNVSTTFATFIQGVTGRIEMTQR